MVTLLGTGTPNLKDNQWGPSTLIGAGETNLLFDCGRGTLLRVKQAGINPTTISRVFLTHLHSDHIVGLPDLWLTGWELGRGKPLRIWGPEGTKSMTCYLRGAFSADIAGRQLQPESLSRASAEIIAEDIQENVIYLANDVTVTSFLVDHGSFKPALGFRVDYQNISVVLSGDTRFSSSLVEHSREADVLIHNAWIAPEGSTVFQLVSSPEEAAHVFNLVNPKLAIISHYNTEEGLAAKIKQYYTGDFVVGRDLLKVKIVPGDTSTENQCIVLNG